MPIASQNSPLARRREKEKDRRRFDIIEAARAVFLARGYAGASMDDIAREAGITKPTVYSYFRTKDGLYYTLTLPVIERLHGDMAAMRDKMDRKEYMSGREIFRDHFRTYHALFSGDPGALRLFLLLQHEGTIRQVDGEIRTLIKGQVKERYEGMRAIYGAAIKEGLIRNVNVYHLVDMLWGSFQGIVQSATIKAMEGSAGNGMKLSRIVGPTLEFAEKVIADALVKK